MGNTAMHNPPLSSSHRVVLVITTERRFGTSLVLLQGKQQSDSDVEVNRVLPFALEGGPISRDEYYEKQSELCERLSQWKGGLYTLMLLIYSILVLLGSIAAHLTPQFWSLPFHDRPLHLCLLVGGLLGILLLLIVAIKWEFFSMQRDVENMYRPWRARGVHTSMKRIATLGKYGKLYSRGQQGSIEFHNVCVILEIAHNEEEGELDSRSVATVETLEDFESFHGEND